MTPLQLLLFLLLLTPAAAGTTLVIQALVPPLWLLRKPWGCHLCLSFHAAQAWAQVWLLALWLRGALATWPLVFEVALTNQLVVFAVVPLSMLLVKRVGRAVQREW